MPDLTASPGRAPPGPMPNQASTLPQRGGVKEPVLLQGDFRKVSGISSEIFRQIEAVENDHDPSTAAALEVIYILFCLKYKKKQQQKNCLIDRTLVIAC